MDCVLPSSVVWPRLAAYLARKGFSIFSADAVNHVTTIVNDVLLRRRQHVERRNDFIQMMVDHAEEVKDEEKTTLSVERNREEGTVLKKSRSIDLNDPSLTIFYMFEALNDKEILSQALVFMVAGYETTSVLMSFFFYVMVTEPVVQEKVYEEIRQEIADVCHH